jgi:hypothetical protein
MKKITFYKALLIFAIMLLIIYSAKSYQSHLQEEFDKCTEVNGGDWGCDSCHYLVYGYYEDEGY